MAIAIHTSPELTGRTAEQFVEAAENRPATRPPLTDQEEAMLSKIVREGRAFKEKLLGRHG